MADLGAIFSTVSRASALALELYRFATGAPEYINHASRIAKAISNSSSNLKQFSTLLREDDSLPSPEAIETLEDVLEQCNAVFTEVERVVLGRDGPEEIDNAGRSHCVQLNAEDTERLYYLHAHLDGLKATISVMQQTLYTAQGLIWARTRPTISPQQAAAAVANERNQLENLVIDQQMSILIAIKKYEPIRPDARLLMEEDSSRSLAIREQHTLSPTDLHRYQDRFLTTLDISETNEEEWMPAVVGISKSHRERVLERWTSLRQFQERLYDEQWHLEARKRETKQPTVESESEEEEDDQLPKLRTSDARLETPTPRHTASIQPLFTEATTEPIPVPDSKFGPIAPFSPASSYGASPRTSVSSMGSTNPTVYSPVSPRSSISSLPVEAAAAVEAKDKDVGLDLEIPWRLCTRKHYWEFVDNKIMVTNSDLHHSNAFSDKGSWTEILASWVCKDAIKEARYQYTQIQKERQDGRRTTMDTCFCIQHPLNFAQVQRLVERTVEIYRQTHKSPSPPPPPKRPASFDRRRTSFDRDKTPLAIQHPPLQRSSTHTYPPLPPPRPLDRTNSMPGVVPIYPQASLNARPSNLQMPIPIPRPPYKGQPVPQSPQGSYTGQPAPYSPQAPPYSPSNLYPPTFNSTLNPMGVDPRRSSENYRAKSPLRQSQSQSQSHSRQDHYSSASTTSDSDAATRRKHRSKSRRPSSSSQKKKNRTVGTLATLGGMAALLDGIVDLGVL